MQAGAAGQPNTPFIAPKTGIQGYADIKKIKNSYQFIK